MHHGYFWRGEDARIVGTRRRRIALLLEHDINLFAFHLPLDAHPEVGNNAALARTAGFEVEGRCGDQDLVFYGSCGCASDAGRARRPHRAAPRAQAACHRRARSDVGRVAWCTGAAQGFLEEAVRLGVDAYITGEVSEQTVHLARESGVAFIAAGHHATERYGVQALGAHLAARFGLIAQVHIDIANPV